MDRPGVGQARILSILRVHGVSAEHGQTDLVYFVMASGKAAEMLTSQRSEELGLGNAWRSGCLVPIPTTGAGALISDARMTETILPGFARIVKIRPAWSAFPFRPMRVEVQYLSSDGRGSVTLSLKRAKALGLVDGTRLGRLILVPKP
jgi:hypothetical protein